MGRLVRRGGRRQLRLNSGKLSLECAPSLGGAFNLARDGVLERRHQLTRGRVCFVEERLVIQMLFPTLERSLTLINLALRCLSLLCLIITHQVHQVSPRVVVVGDERRSSLARMK